jgi:hypothetical protein
MQTAHARTGALRIGYLVRWSTPGQNGNYRGQEQDDALPGILARQGFAPVRFKEGQVSGRDLSKRDEAQRLLAAVDTGEIDGIGAFDVKRITRDETGYDAGEIIRRCLRARAIICTAERQYRLWERRDLRDFKRDALDAGENLLDIRDTFWQGLIGRAKREAFFMARPPVGYTTRLVEVTGAYVGDRTRVKREPVRDETQAEMMRVLGEALDECVSLGQVQARMNRTAHLPLVDKGPARGSVARWEIRRLRNVVANPLYAGTWAFGRNMAADSPIRQLPNWPLGAMQLGNTTNEGPAIAHERPDLAWYEPERQRAWQRKYAPRPGAPKRRTRDHDHPLLGVVLCNGCNAPLVAHGEKGMSCAHGDHKGPWSRCAAPAFIGDGSAMDALWSLLPRLLAERQDALDVLRSVLADDGAVARKRDELEEIRAGLSASIASYTGGTLLRAVPAELQARWAEVEADIARRDAEVRSMEQATVLDGQRERLYALLAAEPQRARGAMTLAQQGQFFRDVVAGVVVEASGRGRHRSHAVTSYRNLLLPSEVSGATGCGMAPYLTRLLA